MSERTGKITPAQAPMKGELVYDPAYGQGEVMRTIKGPSGACWVKFPGTDEVYYSLRASRGVWIAFPGPADADGLRYADTVVDLRYGEEDQSR